MLLCVDSKLSIEDLVVQNLLEHVSVLDDSRLHRISNIEQGFLGDGLSSKVKLLLVLADHDAW